MTDCPGLVLSQNDDRLLAAVVPAGEPSPRDMEQLRAFLAASGFAEWALFDEALSRILLAYNQGAACAETPIGERRDGKFALEISADAMQVWLELSPACAGQPVNPEQVYQALGENGVTFGVDTGAIKAVCTANVAKRVVVAAGVPAVDGEDSRFEVLVSEARDRTPQVNDQGLIDFRELGEIQTVAAEQPLMRRIPATNGMPGKNVRGEEIAAKTGRNLGFSESLVGSYVDPADSNLLRAVFSGQPVIGANGVDVEHVLRVRNVNMATGNIAFDGSVHIDGEVLPGMKVNATGDIVVGDVIDGAQLEAGGDIVAKGGIIAKASVRAAGSVSARFVENAHVYAGTTLVIEDAALQADLQANNQILVGTKNPHGKLAGGSARAMLLIRAPILGATTSGVTQLTLGVNPVLDAQYHEVLQQIEKRKEEEDKLDKLLKHLVKQGDKTGMQERVTASRQQVVKAWGKLMLERDALEKQLAQIAEARVEVGVEVVGAVDITFGKKILRVRKNQHGGVFSLQGDQILFTDASGGTVSQA